MAHADIRQSTLNPVRSQVRVVTADITRVSVRASTLPVDLRTQVASAIASASWATANTQDAIKAVADAEPHLRWAAQTSLQDARTGLDAAAAELRYVTDLVRGVNSQISAALDALQVDIDILRG